MSKPTVAIIVAALKKNGGIGYQGKMPWRLKKEIKWFKDVTTRTSAPDKINAVVMGRKTWESIPAKFRPLPGRLNVVLSRTQVVEPRTDGVIHATSIASSLDELHHHAANESKLLERVFIIGGAEIYNELVKDHMVSHLLITEIDTVDPATDVPLDTFLRFGLDDADSPWQRRGRDELETFVRDTNIESDIVEGDFVYNYTLWGRK